MYDGPQMLQSFFDPQENWEELSNTGNLLGELSHFYTAGIYVAQLNEDQPWICSKWDLDLRKGEAIGPDTQWRNSREDIHLSTWALQTKLSLFTTKHMSQGIRLPDHKK